MKNLFQNKFAPLTFSIGFIDAPLEEVSKYFIEWRKSLHKNVEFQEIKFGFENALRSLEPLTTIWRKELLITTDSKWTAYFQNCAKGADVTSPVSHMCFKMKCRGLSISCIPNTLTESTGKSRGTYGAVSFELFSEKGTEFLNYERSVAAVNDGGKWVFVASGRVQDFEDIEKYKARKIKDRFTDDMLEYYCKVLNINIFDEGFYGPNGIIIHVLDPLPKGFEIISLSEAQKRLGINSRS